MLVVLLLLLLNDAPLSANTWCSFVADGNLNFFSSFKVLLPACIR